MNNETHPHPPRFPANGILSLLDVNHRFNLAESTSKDLTAREILDLLEPHEFDELKLGYGSSQGLPRLRNAIASGTGCDPDSIVTTTGTCLALALLAAELCQGKDQVILTTPSFPPSRDVLALGTGAVTPVQLTFEEGYRLNIESIERVITSQTSLVMVASPQNPSGVSVTTQEVDQLLGLIETTAPHAYLFIDETYRVASYGNSEPANSFANHSERIITASSVSKAHGAPGLRVGWLTCHNTQLRERLILGKMNTVISGSPLNELLAAHLLEREQQFLQPRRKLLAAALDSLERWIAKNSRHVDWVKPDAGALACVRLRESAFEQAAVHRFWHSLAQHQLQLGEGSWFGDSDRICRLGFGFLELDEFAQALQAFERALKDAQTDSSPPPSRPH